MPRSLANLADTHQVREGRRRRFGEGVVSMASARVWHVFAAAVMITAGTVCGASVQAQRSEAPFTTLTGTWSGGGQVRLEGGKTERISCKAYYTPRDGGTGVGIALRCASTSYSINLRSVLASSSGKVTGTWEEQTFKRRRHRQRPCQCRRAIGCDYRRRIEWIDVGVVRRTNPAGVDQYLGHGAERGIDQPFERLIGRSRFRLSPARQMASLSP